MPAFEHAVFDYLSGDPGVAALVGERIYLNRLAEKALIPAITYHRVDAPRTYTFDAFEDTDAWVQARVQFNCWSNTPDEAMTVGEAVLAALSGYDGDMAGQLIGSSFAVNEFDIYEAPTRYHRRILDFIISYEDALTTGS